MLSDRSVNLNDPRFAQVRVEVLGVLDRATGLMRLRATEPVAGSSQAERFTRIFEPLPIWIHRNTKIITVSFTFTFANALRDF